MKKCEDGRIFVSQDELVFKPVETKQPHWNGEINRIMQTSKGVMIDGEFHRIYTKPYFKKNFVILDGKEIELV